ncbi:MAG TPA: arylsulfotransferase family protein, partial [Thermomicrobiales bacterium]|nr:arylsulfotransferase family protein [Thermomicrobiales bacterium]
MSGSISGGHSGILKDHADGDGVSYLPDAYFIPGELVTVQVEGVPDLEEVTHNFGVVQPVPWVATPTERDTENPEVPPRAFRSRPDLRPPVMEIPTPPTDEVAPGLVMLAAMVVDGQNGAMILDDEGELIWFSLPVETTSQINDLRVQEYRGDPVLTWMEYATPIGFGLGHFVMCDSSYRHVAELQVGNGFPGGDLHEFLITPRDTALVMIYNAIEWDLSEIGGSKHGLVIDNIIQELEVETGRVLFEWHTLDHIPVHETRLAFDPADNRDHPFDYFHMNSIEEDPDGNLIISARHTFGI